MNKTFFFYDLETSGLEPRLDRIMQFAGQRTDLDFNPIGEPVDILVKMTDDALPNPGAIMVTGITPQKTLAEGITEAEFVRLVTEEIFVPNTIVVGFNNVRFDDEFMRAILWRNFYDPYEWEWKDGRSRWDILDVVRMVRALRPEGINWPVTETGKATNRLELLTKLNGLEHKHAHDALSDVFATIAVAKMLKEKQPEMIDFLFKIRDKKEVKKYVNLENKRPFVYTSGRYSGDFEKTTVAFPLTSGRNGNVLVYDLRYGLGTFENTRLGTISLGERPRSPKAYEVACPETSVLNVPFPIVKELCYNKCPAIAPIGVLDKNDGWEKIGLSKEQIEENLQDLLAHPEFAEVTRSEYENRPEFSSAIEPEAAIYEGFLGDADRVKVSAVRNADEDRLADFHPDFDDVRLPELLLHYKGRNFPKSLSSDEMKRWEKYRRERLMRQATKFLDELAKNYEKDEFVAEELKLYFESLMEMDY